MRGGIRAARRFGAVVTVALTTLALAGCSAGDAEPAMDHSEAAAELNSLLEVAQTEIGGDWENSDSGAADCDLPWERTGAQYSFTRFGPGVPVEQQQAVIDTVLAGWAEAGFEAFVTDASFANSSVTLTEVTYRASADDESGLWMRFGISTNLTAVMGTTRCVPGDSYEINKKRLGRD